MSNAPNRHPSGANWALSNEELDNHWRKVLESGKAPDILVCLDDELRRRIEALQETRASLQDWARQDIANARQHGRP